MELSKKVLELELTKCKAAIQGFGESIEIHKILVEGLNKKLEKFS